MFAVYDVDNASPSLEDDDFLGQVETTLGTVVSSGSLTLKLQHKNVSGEGKGDLGTITVSFCVCVCVCVCVLPVCWEHKNVCEYNYVCLDGYDIDTFEEGDCVQRESRKRDRLLEGE